MISFTVPGTPVAKGRPRFARAGRHVRTFTPEKTVAFQDRVRLFASEAGVTPLEGPVSLAVYAWWPMRGQPRKRVPRPAEWKGTKPDADNVGKAVADALNGIAYRDDSQVARLTVHTFYAGQDGQAHTFVELRPLTDEEMPDA